MKKAIALLIAVATAFSISVGAIAAVGGTDISRSLEYAAYSSEANPMLHVAKGQIVLGYSAGGGPIALLPDTFLMPGHEYKYDLYQVNDDYTTTPVAPNAIDMTRLNDDMLAGARLRLRTVKGGTGVISAKLEKKGSGANAVHSFVIETRETYGTKVNDLEYNIVVTGQPAGASEKLLDANILLKTGYRAMLDDDIDSYSEGDTVTVLNDRPVITKKQFETLAKNFNFKPVSFMGEGIEWNYIGRVSGMNDANFLTNHDVVPEIINAYPDQDYKFITFNAGIAWPTTGEMRVDVSDMNREGSGTHNHGLHAYLYRDGAMTPINSTYDATSDELVFRTNYLGAFVLTDKEILEFGVVTEPEITEPEAPILEEEEEHLHNPPTGAASTAGLIAIGLAAIASGGFATRKRK